MSTSSKLLIYTGAPLSKSLQWQEEHLVAPLQPSFSDIYPDHHPIVSSSLDQTPNWRSLPLYKPHLPTGLTQATNPDFRPAFPSQNIQNDDVPPSTRQSESHIDETSYADISENYTDEDEESQYYEHSFAIHEDIPSSQVLPPSTATPPSQSQSSTSFISTSYGSSDIESTSYSILSTTLVPHDDPLNRIAVTDLKDLPNAQYLRRIEPQTMTVNLLVGLIAIPAPRIIRTRRDNSVVELVEMIVGDETKAGVGVNIWLPHSNAQAHPREKANDALRGQVEGLRPTDIVLMRNVALTSFRDRVYGQSLRRGMTKIELVHRLNVMGGNDSKGLFGAKELERAEGKGAEKVKRVRGWCLDFVGGGRSDGGGGNAIEDQRKETKVGREFGGKRRGELPADSQ
ncbi:MAG: hypothetical protein Q9228_006474 [Teloschistes exilis]